MLNHQSYVPEYGDIFKPSSNTTDNRCYCINKRSDVEISLIVLTGEEQMFHKFTNYTGTGSYSILNFINVFAVSFLTLLLKLFSSTSLDYTKIILYTYALTLNNVCVHQYICRVNVEVLHRMLLD